MFSDDPSQGDDGRVPGAFWERASRHYDRQVWLERAAIRTAVALLDLTSEDRLLDAGTGTGALLSGLLECEPIPLEVVGVDSSAAMLSHVPPLPYGWTLKVADIRALPFGPGEFDVATACYVLHVLGRAERAAALAELRRVLRPGGTLVVVTPAVPARGLARAVAVGLDRLSKRLPSSYGGLRALDPRPGLRAAGFEIAETRWATRGYVSICIRATRSIDSGGIADDPAV